MRNVRLKMAVIKGFMLEAVDRVVLQEPAALPQAAHDLAPFVSAPDQASLGLSSEPFFASKVSKLFPAEQ